MAIKSEIVGRIGRFKAIKLNDGRDHERRPLKRMSGGEAEESTGEDGVRCVLGQTGKGDIWAVQELPWRVQWGLDVARGNLCSVTHTGFVSRPCSDGTCWRVQVGRASVIRNPACLP